MACTCGKEHRCDIEKIEINEDSVSILLTDLKGYKSNEILVVYDKPILKSYHKIIGLLSEYDVLMFDENAVLIPDEEAVMKVSMAINKSHKLIVAVGSGVINDLCRYVSFNNNMPYWIMMSAPSMDGYASTASPLIQEGIKNTVYCHVPQRIYGIPSLLKKAPYEMIMAGCGDFIGKVTAVADWRLSAIIKNEYICPVVAEDLADRLTFFGKIITYETIANHASVINEHLLQSGIYMSYVGNSRPASGSEHLVSHILEMKAIEEKLPIPLHGLKVGVATYYVLELYKYLLKNMDAIKDHYSLTEQDLANIAEIGHFAVGYYDVVKKYHDTIMPALPYGVSDIIEAMLLAPDLRERFTMLKLFKEMGWLTKEKLTSIVS